jgi:drug/metabolite transporter (DMT)-like permease
LCASLGEHELNAVKNSKYKIDKKRKTMIQLLKKKPQRIYLVVLAIVLVGKISNWFFNYGDETNAILNTVMFSVIGITYLVMAWAFEKALVKGIFVLCGVYLIVMNFIPAYSWNSILGIVCILTPLFLGKLSQHKESNEDLMVN